jgi:hypothetical protein
MTKPCVRYINPYKQSSEKCVLIGRNDERYPRSRLNMNVYTPSKSSWKRLKAFYPRMNKTVGSTKFGKGTYYHFEGDK